MLTRQGPTQIRFGFRQNGESDGGCGYFKKMVKITATMLNASKDSRIFRKGVIILENTIHQYT